MCRILSEQGIGAVAKRFVPGIGSGRGSADAVSLHGEATANVPDVASFVRGGLTEVTPEEFRSPGPFELNANELGTVILAVLLAPIGIGEPGQVVGRGIEDGL
jgi:hypothetical protein